MNEETRFEAVEDEADDVIPGINHRVQIEYVGIFGKWCYFGFPINFKIKSSQ